MHEYLGLEGGPPTFRQDFTCPALLKDNEIYTHTGLSPATARLSRRFCFHTHCHWPGPRSLATTSGVSVDVLSCGYLDVSVPRVRFLPLYIQGKIPFIDIWKDKALHSNALNFPDIKGGFPHSDICGSKLIRSSPQLFAAYHVLHRLCMPRHPPNALLTLDRSHCQCPSLVVSIPCPSR